ncbi:MAG: hypothetical protein WD512_13280, partial [Candidatus Paceibacterota bacterium]
DMVLLSYILQRKLRMEFEKDPIAYFDIYKYTTDYQEQIFQPYFNRIREASVFKDPNNTQFYKKKPVQFVFEKASIVSESPIDSNYVAARDYIGKKDVGIGFVRENDELKQTVESFGNIENALGKAVESSDLQHGGSKNKVTATKNRANKQIVKADLEDEEDIVHNESSSDDICSSDQIAMFYLNEEPHSIYVQSNGTLDFKAGGRVKFALVRSKINFNLYFVDTDEKNVNKRPQNLQIGGELIDVSIPHKLDGKIQHFFENMDKYLHKYELSYKGDLLTFTSYALIYLIEDLEYILFKFVQKPWEAPKYEKRVNRLFYLYMIDIFNKIKTNDQRETFLRSFVDMVDRLNNSTELAEMNQIIETFKVGHEDVLRYLHIDHLLEYLKSINNILVP